MRYYTPENRGSTSPHISFYHSEKGNDGRFKTWRESTGTSDPRSAASRAEAIVTEWRKEQAALALGIEVHAGMRSEAVGSLIVEYGHHLRARAASEKHVYQTSTYIARAFELAEVDTVPGMTSERLRIALDKLTKLPGAFHKDTERGPASSRTVNAHHQAVKQFFNWLRQEGRWGENPTDGVERRQVIEERPRRALEIEELVAILTKSPPHRALVYRVAATSGARTNELRTLRWADVDLEAGVLTVSAKRAKGRVAVAITLPPSTIEPWLEFKKNPGALEPRRMGGRERCSWEQRIKDGLALPPVPILKTYYRDLESAGVQVDHETRLDLHALRVTYCTLLGREGVHPALIQQLMRHSDPKLTMNIYTRLQLNDRRQASSALDAAMKRAEQPSRTESAAV